MDCNNNCNNNRMFNGNSNGVYPLPDFHSLPQESFDSEEMRGSMQNILAQNVGEYVVVEFLIGTERIMRKQGLLYQVGRSFVSLYDDEAHDYIVCDIFSIKFVYFFYPNNRPNRNYNVLPPVGGENGNNGGGRR